MSFTSSSLDLTADSFNTIADSVKTFIQSVAVKINDLNGETLGPESQTTILALVQRLRQGAWFIGSALISLFPPSYQRSIRLLNWRHGVIGLVTVSAAGYVLWPSLEGLPKRYKKNAKSKSKDSKMMLMRRKKRAGKYTVGLINPANDCFANSNLQALASLRILYGYISHLALIMPPAVDSDSPSPSPPTDQSTTPAAPAQKPPTQPPLSISIMLGKTIVLLNEPILSPKSASPWPFLHVLEKFYNSHISRNQHDAHELLHLILETLETEHGQLCKIYNTREGPNKTTVIPDFPFQGTTLNKITCTKCNYSPKASQSTFIVFSVMVPQKRSVLLTELMNEVSSPEYIKDYGCVKCRASHVLNTNNDPDLIKELGQYTASDSSLSQLPEELEARLPRNVTSLIAKSMQFGKLPQILSIHLSRSIYGGFGASRNSCKVNVVEYLELMEQQPSDETRRRQPATTAAAAAAAQMLGGRNKVTYQLMAMIRHKGTHYAGHYECFRRKNLDWWIDHLPSFNVHDQQPSSSATTTAVPPSSSSESTNPSSSDTSVDQPATPTTNAPTNGSAAPAVAEATTEEENHDRLPFPQDRVSRVSSAKVDTSIDSAASSITTASIRDHHPRPSSSTSSRPLSPSMSPQSATATSATARYFGPEVAPPSTYEWWKISDDKVSECSTRDVLKEESGAYLLFYERLS